MAWWNPFTWFPVPSIGRGTRVYPPHKLVSSPYLDEPQDILKRRMFDKDRELAARFYGGNAGSALREWQSKYPEDFVGVMGSTPVGDVVNNPDHVKPIA